MARRLLTLLWHDVYRRELSESGFRDAGADRYKLALREFEAQVSRLAPELEDARPVLVTDAEWARRPGVRCGCRCW